MLTLYSVAEVTVITSVGSDEAFSDAVLLILCA